MQKQTSAVLSIAGYDPSAGAGVLADVKTFEQTGSYGCAVISCLTFQNDKEFDGLRWIPVSEILQQLEVLSRRFRFDVVKFGLVENIEILVMLSQWLKSKNPDVRIIWDPIIKASAGFEFHQSFNAKTLHDFLSGIYLITPNIPEFQFLTEILRKGETAQGLSQCCRVYLKGGHGHGKTSTDFLYENGTVKSFEGERIDGAAKHGSGCVLSAAMAGYLQQGKELREACKMAKNYVRDFLRSSDELIGFHAKTSELFLS